MIAGNFERVRGSQLMQIVDTIGTLVLRPGECGIEQAVVAHAGNAAMLGKLSVMDGQYHSLVEEKDFDAPIASALR